MYLIRSYLVNCLRIIWLLVVAWYELGTFSHHVYSCPWPDAKLAQNGVDTPTHVLIIADPQILNHRSYPERPPWLGWLSQVIVDLNLRKSWRAVFHKGRPDAVVFLGDMMDGGRFAMHNDEYERYYRRFQSVFVGDGHTPIHYLPGNHDVGLGYNNAQFSDRARARYTAHFGKLNQQITLANHTLLLIDGPGLVDEDHQRLANGASIERWAAAMPGDTLEYIVSFATKRDRLPGPTILFTHVPLARPQGASCGPLRERGTIRQGAGSGYQNTLEAEASRFILSTVRPALIFSGDDHDYCEYNHTIPSLASSTVEVTVKSASLAMGIRRPGYELLSLITPSSSSAQTFAHTPCLLPDQLGIYMSVYAPLFGVTLLALLALHIRRRGSPSRIEDEDGEELSLPSAWRSKSFIPRPMLPLSFSVRARRLTLSPTLGMASLWTGARGDKGRRVPWAVEFGRDLWGVTWAPLALFAGITWWAFWF